MGIGLSGPDASFVLDISGDIQFRGDISGSGAKLYNIPNEALDNSMITINGMDVSLGGSLGYCPNGRTVVIQIHHLLYTIVERWGLD